MIRAVAVAVAVLAVAAVAGCGERTVDAAELEDQLTTQYETVSGGGISSVSCPDDVPAEVDETFDCDAEFDDGSSLTVQGTITAVEGDSYEAEFEFTDVTGPSGTTGADGA